MLESLPPEDRLAVWSQVASEQAGDVFVEASDAVRRFIVAEVGDDAILPLLERLDAEDLAYVSPSLPEQLAARAYSALEASQRSLFEDTIQYDRQAVGYHMTREWVEVDERQTVGDVLKTLRDRGELPPQTDHVLVVDARHVVRGTIALPVLLVQAPTAPVAGLVASEFVSFLPHDDATTAIGRRSSDTTWCRRRWSTNAGNWSAASPWTR